MGGEDGGHPAQIDAFEKPVRERTAKGVVDKFQGDSGDREQAGLERTVYDSKSTISPIGK
jgi:hypothetical protein